MDYIKGYSDYENLRAENAGLFKRIECLTSKIYELETKLGSTKSELVACREQNDNHHENEARLTTLVELTRQQLTEKTISVDSLRQELAKLGAEREDYKEQAKTAYQSISTYSAEINELKAAKDDLERTHYHLDSSVRYFHNKMTELTGVGDLSFEKIFEIFESSHKAHHLAEERTRSLENSVETSKLESRAARETIQRLASEVSDEQQMRMKNETLVNETNSEISRLQAECSALSGEVRDLCGRLETAKNDKYNLSSVLGEKTRSLDLKNCELNELTQSFNEINQSFEIFRSQLAELLHTKPDSPYYSRGVPELGELLQGLRGRLNQIEAYEYKIHEMGKDLEFRDSQDAEHFRNFEESKKTEAQMAADIRQLREALASTEIIAEGLREGKQNHLRFLEELSLKLKLSNYVEGFSTESAALVRAEQLVAMETDAVASKSSQVHILQRKMKGMREQIENKDLHNTMLRKKLIQLEEDVKARSNLQQSQDNQIFKSHKLIRVNEKLNEELAAAKREIQRLKADLCDSAKREKSMLEEDSCRIKDLEDTINGLESSLSRQNCKISKLKEQKNKRETLLNETSPRIQTMESHIDGLTQSLEESREREKQLMDLREAIARMLSLDISTLAIPDYEILSRLESVIHSVVPAAPREAPMNLYDVPDELPPPTRLYDVSQKELLKKKTTHSKKLNMKVDPIKY